MSTSASFCIKKPLRYPARTSFARPALPPARNARASSPMPRLSFFNSERRDRIGRNVIVSDLKPGAVVYLFVTKSPDRRSEICGKTFADGNTLLRQVGGGLLGL